MTTSNAAPMRGARVRAVRCPVQGHGYGSCGIAMSGEPESRTAEREALRGLLGEALSERHDT